MAAFKDANRVTSAKMLTGLPGSHTSRASSVLWEFTLASGYIISGCLGTCTMHGLLGAPRSKTQVMQLNVS